MREQDRNTRTKLVLSTLLILAVTLPLSGLRLNPRWRAIVWYPAITPRNVLELVLNVCLYVPFGYWLMRSTKATPPSVRTVVAVAFLLSLAIETSQLFGRRRFPSLDDLVTNTTGAWIGAAIARSRKS